MPFGGEYCILNLHKHSLPSRSAPVPVNFGNKGRSRSLSSATVFRRGRDPAGQPPLRGQNCSERICGQFCFPAAQTSSRKEQNRVMLLREGEREGRLKRKPLGQKRRTLIFRGGTCQLLRSYDYSSL
jgi:hypothetical protein